MLDSFKGIAIVHLSVKYIKCFMNFIKYEINKICNVNENDFVNFLNDIELYAKYNEGKKEAIFVITIIEDIFKIFELKE